MSALQTADLQNSARTSLTSQDDQPGGPSVLAPFSENLNVDGKLKLSNENFKETIDGFYKDQNISPLSQLTATPAFPTPHVLAQLASKAYRDYETKETDVQYETRLALPDGWKLLTTASNNSKTNGYFGAAYWHPEHQQVVIAHRGTKLSKLGALWTDVVGVVFQHHVPQMSSASTFAHKVFEVLREVKRERGVIFQLFFTGHSLGGWLAQVTTFTTEYLKREGNLFLRSYKDNDCYHPHTVVFDSPGCKNMLSQMRKAYFARLDGSSVDLKHLDITSYLSAPNRINTCNKHVGTVYRIFPDLSDTVWLVTLIGIVCRIITYLSNRVWLTGLIGTVCHLFTYFSETVWFTGIVGPVYHCFSYLSHTVWLTSLRSTAYRLFFYLSDMVWQIEPTVLYNIKTHSVKKIVQALDPETGQVHKDEQRQLKVQLVVDWPISAGLRRGEEYKKFFAWAEDLNNYNPDIKDLYFQHMHYCPIRYQTKLCDERVNSFSIFSAEEQEFLQSYRRLRKWPELFRPKELFSVIGDNQAQDEVAKLLQSFEIENDTICCTDASTLQALIPYVKRLLQLFSEIKENTKRALSEYEVRSRVYQRETRSCIEQINQSPLDFNPEASSLREFLESEQQQVLHLQMFDGDEWTGLIKVYQGLQKTNCLIEAQCTVIKLQHFLVLNQSIALSTLMQSIQSSHLILVACEANELLKAETKDIVKTLFETIRQKPSIKIILTTRSEDTATDFLNHTGREIFGHGFVTRDEKLNWSDLTSSSQEKLLEKSVKFQGARISLNEIMSVECQVKKYLSLGALLEDKGLTIADTVPVANAYNEGYYIGRTLRHQAVTKKSIFNDIGVRYSHFYLARTEQEYKDMCQKKPTSNVHWLQEDKSGNLVWQQTQGSLETLRRYIDTESSHTYTTDDVDKLLEQAQRQRVTLISDTAGMGKSTLLTYVSKQIKQKFPATWLVRIYLNDHTDALKELKEKQIDKEKVTEFVSEKLLKLKPGLETELFKLCCEQKQKVKTVIMLDGFDEISPFYKESVIDLLQALRQTEVEQLWVTTRPHLRKELEDELQQLSYTLEPFSEENQVEFLTKFWSLKDWFIEMNNEEKEASYKKLEIYAKELIKKLSTSISDKDRQFTGIPLQTRMLAEAFEEEVKKFHQSVESMPGLLFKLDLLELYRQFIERKYDIYQLEKGKAQVNTSVAMEQRERELRHMRRDHQLLALKVLFTEEQVEMFQNNTEIFFSTEELTRIGIVQVSEDGKPHFIHRTFAEYCVADCLVNRLTEGKNTSEQVQKFILKDIFLKLNYEVIRVFINGLLSGSNHSDEVLKQCGSRVHDLGNYCVLLLHRAAQEGNGNIVAILLDSLQAAEHTDTLVQMLLAKDDESKTAWIMATERGNLQVVEKLWDCANEKLTTEEIKINLLLATDDLGRTVLHMAAGTGRLEMLEKVWEWANEKLTTEQINEKLLLATDDLGRTVLHMVAVSGGLEILQKVWEWAKEKLTTEEIKNKLLLATDKEGKNAFHIAANWSRLEILQKVWECSNDNLTKEEINNNLLLATDKEGRTVFHMAAMFGGLEILEKVWAWATEKLTTEEINNKLLLATDDERRNIFHMTANWSKAEILEKVWKCANEKLTTEEINNNLLLATDKDGRTVLHMAAGTGRLEILEKVWEWANKKLTPEGVKYKLLLATDKLGRTVLHMAAVFGGLEIIQKVREWAKEKLNTEEIKNELLLATDYKGRAAFHMAADHGKLETLQKVLEWAKEELTAEEINNKLLLVTDNNGRTVLYMAAEYGGLDKLQKLWEWAKEKLTTEEINNKLLLATDKEGRTVFSMAADQGRLEILQKFWECANEKLTREEINNNLLLATDHEGKTVFNTAAERGRIKILQKVWKWANEKLTTEEINNKLLLATDHEGRTVFHRAALQGRLEILQKVWEWANEKLKTEEINNKLLLATDDVGRTVLHLTAHQGRLEISEKIWEWANEKLTTEDINNKLLLATDNKRRTVFYVAAVFGGLEMLHKLWEWANEKLTTEEINNNLLLATDYKGRTVFLMAAYQGRLEILQRILEWAIEKLTTEEINNKLLLATDNKERTAFYMAAVYGGLEILQKIWDWANKKLTTEEISNKLLLATDYKGRTVFHMAADHGKVEILEKVWEWATEKLAKEEKDKLFVITDSEGRTVFHMAEKHCGLEKLRKVWVWANEKLTEEIKNELLLATDKEGRTAFYMAADQGRLEISQNFLECVNEKLTTEEINNNLLFATDDVGRTVLHMAAHQSRLEI